MMYNNLYTIKLIFSGKNRKKISMILEIKTYFMYEIIISNTLVTSIKVHQ